MVNPPRVPVQLPEAFSSRPPDLHHYLGLYCDGPAHDLETTRREDEALRLELVAQGYRVIVLRYDEDLETQFRRYPEVFGKPEV